ncbi:MAG: hypothetical protein JWN70_593 [Planctomycetaceae bacterium]|nr:hypothetical protein [Planctomycetaceae bacterium]
MDQAVWRMAVTLRVMDRAALRDSDRRVRSSDHRRQFVFAACSSLALSLAMWAATSSAEAQPVRK